MEQAFKRVTFEPQTIDDASRRMKIGEKRQGWQTTIKGHSFVLVKGYRGYWGAYEESSGSLAVGLSRRTRTGAIEAVELQLERYDAESIDKIIGVAALMKEKIKERGPEGMPEQEFIALREELMQ